MEIERLCEAGVLKRTIRPEWTTHTFIIPEEKETATRIRNNKESSIQRDHANLSKT